MCLEFNEEIFSLLPKCVSDIIPQAFNAGVVDAPAIINQQMHKNDEIGDKIILACQKFMILAQAHGTLPYMR
jgi:hypothetical protein